MVMERHADRLAQPMSRRQSWILAGVLGVLGLAIVIAILVATVGSDGASRNGCVNVIVPSSLGAGQEHQCGAAARRWCAELSGASTAEARLVLPECRRAGIRVAVPAR